jgi:hypothetical protein
MPVRQILIHFQSIGYGLIEIARTIIKKAPE